MNKLAEPVPVMKQSWGRGIRVSSGPRPGYRRIQTAPSLTYHTPLCPTPYPVGVQFDKTCFVRQRDSCLLSARCGAECIALWQPATVPLASLSGSTMFALWPSVVVIYVNSCV